MAIPFSDNFKINVGAPIDSKYLNSLNQPYTSTSDVLTAIVEAQRYVGLTVNVNNVEYWFTGSTADSCLVIKTAGGGGGTGTITGGTNGLGAVGMNICLGGTINTGTTLTIGAAASLNIADSRVTPYGIEYSSDYSGTFNVNSLVSRKYVDDKFSGTTYHIPVFNALGNGIQDSTLQFSGNTLCNSGDLTIEVPSSNKLYLLNKEGSQTNEVTFGSPTLSSGYTISNICVAGQATNINLNLYPKGSGCLTLNAPVVNIGNETQAGMSYDRISHVLRLPEYAIIRGYSGNTITPNATFVCVVGGVGYASGGDGGDVILCGGKASSGSYTGGDVVLQAGSGNTMGNVRVCNLPVKTSEINVVYYDTLSGALSYGLATGGTGTGLITGATNGLNVYGFNARLGGTLTGSTVFTDSRVTPVGLQYFGDYSNTFTDRSLIDKGYAVNLNQKLSKYITQVGHGFTVGTVVGFSGNTYTKAIANGQYNGEILGIVSYVSGNTFELVQAGYVGTLSGLVSNKTYFLSDTVAGQMTATEPTTYGHVSKAVLVAYDTNSGWVLPYAGYVISSGDTTGNVNGERISKIVSTAPFTHGFNVNDVIGWSAGAYTKAIANGTYNGEVIGIVTRNIDPNTFEVTQSGYFSGFSAGLSANTTYFLSNIIAGQLTTTKPTTLTHIVRPVLATMAANTGWVLPYPGYVLISGGSGGGTGTTYAQGIGITISAQTISANVIYGTPIGTPMAVKVSGATGNLYVDSADFSGGTSPVTGGTNIGTGIGVYDGLVNKNLEFRSLVGSGNTSISQVGDEIIIYSSGGTGSGTITGATNIGSSGGTIYAGVSGQNLQFKGIVGSGNTTVTQTGSNVIIYSSGGTEPVFSTNLTVSIASGKTFGRYENGDTILAIGKTARQVIQMAIAEPLEPTVNLSSSSQNLAFGLSAKTVNLTFSYTINSLGASVSGVTLEWRRNNSGTWSGLTTNTGATTYNHTIYETNRFNTQVINYRYTVTDTLGGTKTATYDRTPLPYTAPTVSSALNGTITSPETQTVREKGNVISSPSGSIAATQSLVDITDWTLERRYNGGGWTILASGSSLNTQLVTISSTLDNTVPTSATSIDYRITYVDEYTNSTGGAQSISFKYFSYWGYNTNTTLTESQIEALVNKNFLTSQAMTWNNVNTPSGNYTYYAYPSTYADITSIIKNGVNQDFGAWSQLSQVSVTNTYGEALNYKVWKTNATSAYNSTDDIVIS